jgi:Bacterial Ig-like domain (group 1)
LLKLTAVARAAAAANLSFDDAPGESRSSRAKGKHLVALVTDAFGNPVPDARLSFSTRSGSVAPSRAVSDAKGRVKVSWTLGTKPGDQSLTGIVQGTDVRASFVVAGTGTPTHTPAKAASTKVTSSKATKKRS